MADDMVSIHVKPDFMLDEPLDISITGLKKGAKITVGSYMKGDIEEFGAHGHYIADSYGNVKLNEESSIGGTYCGLEPMGIFWSLEALPGQKPGLFYYHKHAAQSEMLDLTVHEGHLGREELMKISPASKVTVRRHCLADDVERIEVRHGGILGVLYKPKGVGPFPGVLHMYGQTGAAWDILPCRLASRGFAAFHLQYIEQEHLPKSISNMEMSYFFEAVDWFCNEPYIQEGGIQGVGNCTGGALLLYLASMLPKKIVSVVDINGLTSVFFLGEQDRPPRLPSGNSLQTVVWPDLSKVFKSSDGSLHYKGAWDCSTAPEEAFIKVENIGKILFIVGREDEACDNKDWVKHNVKRLQALGKNNYQVLQYPGAGHLIEVPYQPLIYKCRYALRYENGQGNAVITWQGLVWGGKPNAHAKAQEHSWKKIQEFLIKNKVERTPFPGQSTLKWFGRLFKLAPK